MRKSDYEAYIESPEWASRRAAYYSKHPRVCQGCASKQDIHLHHHTYERVGGQELDADLIPLCAGCHDLVHCYYKVGGKNLSVCTFEVLDYLNGRPARRPKRVASRMQVARTMSAFCSPRSEVVTSIVE